MIIKLESTEFIFSGFVVFPIPSQQIHNYTHTCWAFFWGGDDLVLSISIFILGPHWWHHRGYHQRHRRSCYKDVWYRNIGMTRYNHDVFMIYMVSWHDEQRHHENVFYKDLWYRKTCATCRHVLLEKHGLLKRKKTLRFFIILPWWIEKLATTEHGARLDGIETWSDWSIVLSVDMAYLMVISNKTMLEEHFLWRKSGKLNFLENWIFFKHFIECSFIKFLYWIHSWYTTKVIM